MRTHCSYCRGNTTEDFYGNCSACGAPKNAVQPVINPPTLDESAPAYFPHSGSYCGYETYQQLQEASALEYAVLRLKIQNDFYDSMSEPQKKHAIPEFVRSLLRR